MLPAGSVWRPFSLPSLLAPKSRRSLTLVTASDLGQRNRCEDCTSKSRAWSDDSRSLGCLLLCMAHMAHWQGSERTWEASHARTHRRYAGAVGASQGYLWLFASLRQWMFWPMHWITLKPVPKWAPWGNLYLTILRINPKDIHLFTRGTSFVGSTQNTTLSFFIPTSHLLHKLLPFSTQKRGIFPRAHT